MPIPSLRLTAANSHPLRPEADYVLYWMIAQRRPVWNFALEHAVDRARELGKPLVIFEPLRTRYRWASDRIHRFVIEGMRENAAAFAKKPVLYYPYVEPAPGTGTPLLHRLAQSACVVISDEYPCFFLPTMIDAVKERIAVRLELVDSNGLLPLRLADRTFTVAHSYRRWMQKQITPALEDLPVPDPLARSNLTRLASLPEKILRRWPPADFAKLLDGDGLGKLPIDHQVTPAPMAGGWKVAEKTLERFVRSKLQHYDEDRNHPDEEGSTGLSPYLHFGHISPFQMVRAVLDAEGWNIDRIGKPNGKNHDFWNTSVSTEAFLDQVLTWREIGFNMTFRHPETYDRYDSLPPWALQTLDEHRRDKRPYLYSLEQFERAQTHDPVWNAAQRQLVREGRMHNYMRMLWGKKILHWTPSPEQALEVLIELNNKYAVDGRDPNSYSGIFWTLGRYDRAWGPKRPIFGSVRYMTSESAERKLRLNEYLRRYAEQPKPTPVQLF